MAQAVVVDVLEKLLVFFSFSFFFEKKNYLSFSSPSRDDSSCNDSASAPALPD
jgi:hypothetical protein